MLEKQHLERQVTQVRLMMCLLLVVEYLSARVFNRRKWVMRCYLKKSVLVGAGLLILTSVYIYMQRAESGQVKVSLC